MGAGCCLQRDADAADDAPPLRRDSSSASAQVSASSRPRRGSADNRQRLPRQSLQIEWEIVKRSISGEEFERLQELRQRVMNCDTHPACIEREPLSCQPQTLLRFLRGRDGNVARAEEMFRASLDWRHDFEVDRKVLAWQQELREGKSPRARLAAEYGIDDEPCVDKWGVPVWLMRLGVGDTAGLVREIGKETLLIDRLSKMEAMHSHLRRAMFERETLVKGCIQVIDVGAYGDHGPPDWWARMFAGYKAGQEAFRVFEKNYPETTRKIFFVRMGKLTHWLYNCVEPIIPARTKTKMRLFGNEAATWRQELSDEVRVGESLPDFLVCDTDEAFAAASPKGGIVPKGSVKRAPPSPCIDDGENDRVQVRRMSFDEGRQLEKASSLRNRPRAKTWANMDLVPAKSGSVGDGIALRKPSWLLFFFAFLMVTFMMVSASTRV